MPGSWLVRIEIQCFSKRGGGHKNQTTSILGFLLLQAGIISSVQMQFYDPNIEKKQKEYLLFDLLDCSDDFILPKISKGALKFQQHSLQPS